MNYDYGTCPNCFGRLRGSHPFLDVFYCEAGHAVAGYRVRDLVRPPNYSLQSRQPPEVTR